MTLDLQEKLGQLFFVGFDGYTLTNKTRKFLRVVQPGGIVFFENNIRDKKQVKNLIKEINESFNVKPFIAIDQEGGSVERLRNICTSLPSVWGLAKVGLKELLMAHVIIASELLDLGFNMVFGPVLDINSNISNPVIGTRSISNDPKVVANYGTHIIKLYLKYKIIPVIKHFPGHGGLSVDSHISLPILNKTKVELNNFELLPFKKAIQHKTPVVMVGHIQLSFIENDKRRPASLSKNVLNGLLRKELGFKGLITTDELNMKGVTKIFTLQNAAYEALMSGSDLLLFNDNEDATTKAFEYIKGRVLKKDNTLLKRIEESYERLILTKNKFFRTGGRGVRPYAPTRIKKTAYELAQKVVHWIKKDLFFRLIDKNQPIEIIYPITPKLRLENLKSVLKALKIKKSFFIAYDSNPNLKKINKIIKHVKKNKIKILITYDIAYRLGQKSLVKSLLKKYPDLIVISVGLEYDIEAIPEVKNFIAAYGPNYISLFAAFQKIVS